MAHKMICPACGAEMNHHADKLIYSEDHTGPDLGGSVEEFHQCPQCGRSASRAAVGQD